MIVFTICSKNFLGYATSLYESLCAHHQSVKFHVALCDTVDGFDIEGLNFEVLTFDDLGIPKIENMIGRYNITELNTSIKPFVFMNLFERNPGEVIYYFDPDIIVKSRLIELENCFFEGADCVLTPHVLEPAEYAEMEDRQFLIYGIYNLGFCALRDTIAVRRVVSWWGRRLEDYCVIDLENGLFVDQKWADLLPSFIPKTKILHHPGYNVAYWNLSQRRLRRSDDGVWSVNDVPLRFFHFSGNKIEDQNVFSRHSTQFRTDNTGDLSLILQEYRKSVFDHGHRYFSTIPYGFAWGGARGENRHTPVSVSRSRTTSSAMRPYLSLSHFGSYQDFQEAFRLDTTIHNRRRAIECNAIPFHQDAYTLDGFCSCCNRYTAFQVSGMYSSEFLEDGRVFPNWREHLNCLECGLVNRVRASLHIFHQVLQPKADADIYMTEYKTLTFRWMARHFPNVIGSEFFEGSYRSGDIVESVLHQDVQAMSFGSEKFDYIISFDVLEHVPDHNAAFREIFRCLKPGGALLFTVPFSWTSKDHVTRAIVKPDGAILHLMEPEFHGNPVDMEAGSLCYRYFGWSTIDDLHKAGFWKAKVFTYWSNELKYYGDPQFALIAYKPVDV